MTDHSAVPDLYRSFDWSNRLVWSLPLPVVDIPIAEIVWHLDVPLWTTVPGRRLFDLAPRTVLEHPHRYPWHFERILAAEVQYPIDVAAWNGRDVILDGVHRLARLWRDGATRVAIRRVPPEWVPLIRSDEDRDD